MIVEKAFEYRGHKMEIRSQMQWDFSLGGNIEVKQFFIFMDGVHHPELEYIGTLEEQERSAKIEMDTHQL